MKQQPADTGNNSAREVCVLNVLPPDRLEEAVDALMYVRSAKKRVSAIVSLFAPMAAERTIAFPEGYEKLNKMFQQCLSGKFNADSELPFVLAAHLAEGEGNILRASEYWPDAYVDTLVTAYVNYFISFRELTDIAMRYGSRGEAITRQRLAGILIADDNEQGLYMIDCAVRPYIGALPVLKRFGREVSTTDVLPDKGDIAVFNGEDDILSNLAGILDFRDSAANEQNQHPYPSVSEVNCLASVTSLAEFKNINTGVFKFYRRRCILGWLSASSPLCRVSAADGSIDGAMTIRNIFTGIDSKNYYGLVVSLMPQLNLPRYESFRNIEASSVINPAIRTLVRYALPSLAGGRTDVWVDLDQLVDKVLMQLLEADNTGVDAGYRYEPMRSKSGWENIYKPDIVKFFTRPLLYGIYVSFASFGLVELAFHSTATRSANPFDSFIYARLTSLGRYVFGKDKEYMRRPGHRGQEAAGHAVFIDPDNMFIVAMTEEAQALVKSMFGVAITKTRYIVDDKSFMRRVKSVRDLRKKIDTLQVMAAVDAFPPLWEEFFKRLADRLDSIKPYSLTGWQMFAVYRNVSEIMDIMTSDESIREIVIMVEGGRFLVRHEHVSLLRTLLAGHGYRLPDTLL